MPPAAMVRAVGTQTDSCRAGQNPELPPATLAGTQIDSCHASGDPELPPAAPAGTQDRIPLRWLGPRLTPTGRDPCLLFGRPSGHIGRDGRWLFIY